MLDDSRPKSSENERKTIKRPRYRLRRAMIVTVVVLTVLSVTTVVFRATHPISPIGVAEMLGGSNGKRSWRPLVSMPPDLPVAVIASEDGRFCNHWGVDWVAVRDAIKEGGGIGSPSAGRKYDPDAAGKESVSLDGA